MKRGLIARILRRGPTRDEAFDRFARPAPRSAALTAQASAAPSPRSASPVGLLRAVDAESYEREPAVPEHRPGEFSLP